MREPQITDRSIERAVSTILRWGVLLSGAVVMIGGMFFLSTHWSEPVDYRTFHGQPSADRLIGGILAGLGHLRARSVIEFGLLLLLATPITRVAASLVGFALERDWTYVLITSMVLAILLYSIIGGAVGAA